MFILFLLSNSQCSETALNGMARVPIFAYANKDLDVGVSSKADQNLASMLQNQKQFADYCTLKIEGPVSINFRSWRATFMGSIFQKKPL
jgi:hypothetical protein